MNLSVVPVFPLWLITGVALTAVGLRVGTFIVAGRRRGPRSDPRRWARLALSIAAILCLGLAATRLGDESHTQQPPPSTAIAEEAKLNVFLVVDRSMGMLAEDFDGQFARMDAVLNDLQAVIAKYPDARFSVISYADEARAEWPLSSDRWSLTPFLGRFAPYGGWSLTTRTAEHLSTNVAAANDTLADQIRRATVKHPGSANLVYLFGSASDPGDWAFTIPQSEVSGGAVFGYGTEQGADVLYRTDDGGLERVRSRLNEPALQTAAQSLGIPYVGREKGTWPPPEALVTVAEQAAVITDVVNPRDPHPNRLEFYWIFAGLGLLIFGVELYGLGRHWLRRRGTGARR